MAERFKALTRNPVVPSLDPLPASHAGVYSHLPVFLPVRVFNPYNNLLCETWH